MHLVSVALASVLAGGLSAQCVRPTPPSTGLPVDYTLTVSVTYSDGYETFGSLVMPSGAAPVCGWPLVVYVHPLGGSRVDEASLQLSIAEQGYAVWSFDVRGQGQALVANPTHPNMGSGLWGPVERHDLAEQIAFVAGEPVWQGIIDASRLAVIGTSQGGGHAWLAAAWSGELLTTPGRTAIQFPVVSCALPRNLIANSSDDWVRHGGLFSAWWIEAASGNYAALPLDPAFSQAARTAFVNQDPASLQALWSIEQRDLGALLAASTVPVFYSHAYLDLVSGPLSGLDRLGSMPGPTRSMLSTLGHGVPANDLERAANESLTLRWLHRFLWGISNEVDVEPTHQLAMLPLAAVERDDPAHAWNRTNVDVLTPPANALRYYLHDDFVLRESLPTGPQVDPRIEQVIDPAATMFNPVDYFDQPSVRVLANVLTACPLAEKVWSLHVPDNGQLVRSAALHLNLVPDAAAWSVAALLTVEPPGGDEVMVASEALVSRTSVPGVAEQHDLRFPPISIDVSNGAIVRVRLRNLWLREFPMQQSLAVAPLFSDFGVDILIGDQQNGSWFSWPMQTSTPHLVVDKQSIDLATAPQVTASIRGGIGHAGDPYFVAVGLSGFVPATNYLGAVIPLDDDWLVVASAASTQSYYGGFIGFLDASGEATCTMNYSSAAPLPQVLNGLSLTMAGFVWDYSWAPTGAATNAADIMLR